MLVSILIQVRTKIEYYKNVLTVLVNNGVTNNANDYEMCFRAENVFLPSSGHFGLSAATGGLADDHDVLKFLTHSLRPADSAVVGIGGGPPPARVSDAEKEKLNLEYQNFQQKLDTQRKEYHEKHPEAKVSRWVQHVCFSSWMPWYPAILIFMFCYLIHACPGLYSSSSIPRCKHSKEQN
jgi:mannose-binding lectin 1